MSQRKDQIDEEVMKTLRLLDRREGIEAGPYFFTRLQAKILRLEEIREPLVVKMFGMGMLRPALIAGLLVVNLFSTITALRESESPTDVRSGYLTALADEYSLAQSSDDFSLSSR